MARIDAHQHFWNFDPVRDSWITADMSIIQSDFSPVELAPLLAQNHFEGCVAVQATQAESENDFLLQYANNFEIVKGVVGWVDLRAADIEERLQYYSTYKKMKGFRHVLQGEAQRDLMLQPSFLNGIGLLSKYNYTYDILIYEDQLKYIPSFIAPFPQQRFVIDHMAKPQIKAGNIDQWKKEVEALATYENVWCKVSGMVTEADWNNWKEDDFKQYLDVVVETFGTDRIMFGSDWPVCLVAASYQQVVNIVETYFSSFSKDEQDKVFGLNAKNFYNL
jgi:L-fuconolactonase